MFGVIVDDEGDDLAPLPVPPPAHGEDLNSGNTSDDPEGDHFDSGYSVT